MALEPAGVAFIAENLDGFVRDLGKADKAQDALGKSTDVLAGSYRDADGRLRDARGRFIGAGDSAEEAGKQTKRAGEQAGQAGPSFSLLGSIVTGVATAFVTFALDAAVAASKALVGLAADSIQVATDFESSMAVLNISASGVEEELVNLGFGMEDLSEITLAVGGDTRLLGVSASGSAEAITGLFKAGLTAQDVFGDLQGYMAGTAELGGALRASIDLAAATTLDMAQASDLAAIALSTFGGQAEEAGMTADEFVVMAMDNLVRAADASVAEVEGLAEALKMVGPTAGAMSISIQDTNNALALLSTRGIQGSMAGTSLNRMLLDLGKTTPKATAAMEELGIVTYDEQGAMLPLVDIIGQFEIALGDATDAERDAALQAIFTAQGMRSMNVLMGEGIEGWVGMEDAIEGAATMMEQGEARAQTLAAQKEALAGVIETLQIRIGTALLPALTGITTAFSGLVEKYGPMVSAAFEKIGAVLGDLVNWFVFLLEEGDPLNDFLANLPAGFQSVIKTVVGLTEAFEPLYNAVVMALGGDTTGLMEGFAFTLDNLFGPGKSEAIMRFVEAFEPLYNAIVFALGGDTTALMEGLGFTLQNLFGDEISKNIMTKLVDPVVAAVGTVVEVIDKIRQWFVDNGPAIESALDQIGQVFGIVFETIKEVVEDIWPVFEEIGATFGETFEIVKEVLGEFGLSFDDTGSGIETVTGIIIGVIELVGGIIAGVLTAISGTARFFAEHFQGVWMGIRDVVQGVKEWFEGFKQFWTALFNKDMPGALEGLKKGFGGFAKFIKGIVKVIVKSISMPFAGLYKLIEGFVKGVVDFFKNLKKKLVGGSIIPDMMNKIEKVIETVLEAIEKIWNTIFEAMAELIKEVFATIERIIDRVMTAIEKIIDTICKAIGGNWEDFIDLLLELWEDTWDDIRDFVDTVFNAIEKFIDTVSGNIQRAWETFTEAVQEVWEDVWDAIETFVGTVFSNIETLIDTISGNIQEAWETFTEAVQEAWETIWGAIETFVDTTFGNIETLINTISGNIETAWNTFTGNVQAAWETIWGAIETFVDTAFNNIQTLIGTISGAIETAWNTFTGNVLSVWQGIWDDIDEKVREIWGAIETFISTGIQNIVTFFTDAAQNMIDAGAGIVDNIRQGIEDTWQSILDFVSYGLTGESGSIVSQIIAALGTILEQAKAIVDAIRDGITEVWDNITSRIGALIKGTGGYSGIMQAVTDAWNKIKELGGKIVDAIKTGITELWGNIKDAIAGKLEDLGKAGAFAAQIWEWVKDLGGRIVTKIKDGLSDAWATATGVVGEIETKLSGLLGAIGAGTWSTIKEIGGRILSKIQAGVEAVTWWASNFWNWLWGEILGWLAWHSGEEVGEMMGDKITDGLVDSIRSQAGARLLDALNYATGEELRGVGFQVPVQLSAAMQGGIEANMLRAAVGLTPPLGMVAPAMMAPTSVVTSTEVTIGPNYINDGMDLAEFEVRVRQAVSEAI